MVNIPVKGRAKLALVADDRPGSWMYHCHILKHGAAGMVGHYDVIRKEESDGGATGGRPEDRRVHHHH